MVSSSNSFTLQRISEGHAREKERAKAVRIFGPNEVGIPRLNECATLILLSSSHNCRNEPSAEICIGTIRRDTLGSEPDLKREDAGFLKQDRENLEKT